MSKIKNGRLDLDGTEPFEQQLFGSAGIEGVNMYLVCVKTIIMYMYTCVLLDILMPFHY